MDVFLKRYESLDHIQLPTSSLNTNKVVFNSANLDHQRLFWEHLESGPIVGSYNSHSISILGYNSDKTQLYIYDSGLVSNNYSSYPTHEILTKLKQYWTIKN